MDKKMKKPYESPSTKCTLVEMEAGLCAASITDKPSSTKVESTSQGYKEFENGERISWDEQTSTTDF